MSSKDTMIALEDSKKTMLTCPYVTYAFNIMSFGICNTLNTFQRFMIAIFDDTFYDFVDIQMDDDFSVFGESFYKCLENFDKVLARCDETNLVLN